MNSAEQIAIRLQQFQAEQSLILDQVDNAIALFNRDRQLVLFNQKLAQMWSLSTQWLREQPCDQEVFAELVARGYWSPQQLIEFHQAVTQAEGGNTVFSLTQENGVCLQIYTTLTSEGGQLFNFRDVTIQQQAQANLNEEMRRLTFLLGLTEHLQTSADLYDICKFALSYLVQAMSSAFGDVKVIKGDGSDRRATLLTNYVSAQFIATYGEPISAEMHVALQQGIPYGQGLLWKVVETGEPMFVEHYAMNPDGVPAFRHPHIGQLGIFPIPSGDGKIIGVLTLESRTLRKLQEAPQQDMLLAACRTLGVAIERVQSQERLQRINTDLEHASRMKSEFLASMSHELRTPLNSILGFSDLLQRQTDNQLSDRQMTQIQAIERSGQHLLSLINDILDLSKVEAGKAELELQPVSVQDLCRECLRMIQPRAEKKRLGLTLELDYRIQEAMLDERRVLQMLVNLLSNAVKFTPETGSIKLTCKLAYGNQLMQEQRPDHSPIHSSTPYICFEVMDSGIGIPEEKWHLLFQPFQQLDASLTRRHEGSGLGLALTKRLAELHGGTTSFQSLLGQGSAFRIWLPLTEQRRELSASSVTSLTPPPVTGAPETVSATGTQRILIVEDQPYNQVLLTELLELEGYGVELISDGNRMQDAIDSPLLTNQTLPDLILMDIQLPGIDGFELIRQLKAHPLWQRVPVIAVTAMAMAGDRERCFEAGANAYMSKPLALDDVTSNVRALLQPK
ncbi:response regulator [Oculatella sp. LEGE 06141]|uniref:hybrid sensor histidine kinase/response regulator n=1 Tax=Oculatella sp. LEGE 06141 TaxID=1828648 RepID=UPI00187E01F6|nr:ATP-binding protein [Oculatella sp. LEGE 06141]MBE9178107.1 response regulator [Oculatella sp. LEGE 06141]